MFKSLKLKKFTSWMIVLLMTLSIFAPGISVKAASASKTLDLVEITDFHGALLDSSSNQVGAVLANRVKSVEASNPDTIVFGGGDLYQGSGISNMLQGVPVQQVMSSMGMQLTALGNHEFDWGLDTIVNTTMKDAKYSIVCANLYDKTTGQRVFDPYKIVTVDGVKVAFIGAITTETPSIVTPSQVANYNFTDPAAEINKVAAQIKSDKSADAIVAVIHEGTNSDGTTGPLFDIANKLTNVNAVFGGHSHSAAHALASNGIPVYNANNAGKGYIDVKMTVNADGTVSFKAPSSADYIALDNANGYKTANPVVDPEAKQIIDAANAKTSTITDVVIGHNSGAALTRTQVPSIKGAYGESYLGNWSADVLKEKTNADVGMVNNGGIRIDIPTGDITVGTMWQFMPFDDEIYLVPMDKAQLKAILEDAVMDGGKGIQISGIKFSYDPNRPSGNRIYDITREDGTAISDTETLQVAAPDFVSQGGDGFTAFNAVNGSNPKYNTHILLRDAFIDAIKADIDKDPSIVTAMDNRINAAADPSVTDITVLATSDMHGNIYDIDYNTGNAPVDSKGNPIGQGLAEVSTYVKSVRASNPNTLLVDDGDLIQGTPLSYYFDSIDKTSEYPMIKAMGLMGYDTITLGNHEYNYGLDTLNRVLKDAKAEGIDVLSSNTYKTDGSNFVDPYYMKDFTVNGKTIKVGILGLTTKTIPSWEDPAHYAGLKFNDLVTEAQKWVPIMRQNGADIVIAAAHTGEEGPSDVIPENEIKAIATQVNGIDAIIAGHVHNVVNDLSLKDPAGKVVPVVEPGKWGQYVSQLDLGVNNDGSLSYISTKNVKMDPSVYPEDPAITSALQPYEDVTLKYVQTKLGTSTGEYTGTNQLTQPTAIMDLINKVQMQAAGTQLSIAAPLSSAAYIPKGDVTIQSISSVYVYENFLFGIKMTGKQLKDWLEWSVRYYKQTSSPNDPVTKDTVLNVPDYNLDQLYGATYDVDLTQPACTVDKNGQVVSGSRIKNLEYNGKLIMDTDVFTVAINNYRFNGGGGFMAAAGLKPGDTSIVTYDSAKALGDDGQVRNLMMKYVQDNKTITPTVANNWKIYTTPVADKTSSTQPSQNSKTATYVVQKGDCLWNIARKYGMTYQKIGQFNSLKNFNLILIGQKLLIPLE